MSSLSEIDCAVLEAIFGSMEQGVVFIDSSDRIAYFNSSAERIRGARLDQRLGLSILDCHPATSQEKVSKIIDDLRTGKVKGHHRMNIQMTEGKFYDNTYSAVLGRNDEYLGVIVVTQEVTRRKKAEDDLKDALKQLQAANEELKSLDAMKTNFFNNVTHELKTPMISVVGYIGMMLKEKAGPLTEQQRNFLETSYRNLMKLEKNIDNLMDLAELGIRKAEMTFKAVDLVDVVELSCSTVEPLAKENQITVEVLHPGEPVTILGVEEKLQQLFDNLLTNAIKYNREGGRITVSLSGEPGHALTRVADTGVGISQEALKDVFHRHFQEKIRPLGNARGLGIGLSLVQEIVRLHGGEIELESELGRGTIFTVRLPKNPPSRSSGSGDGSEDKGPKQTR